MKKRTFIGIAISTALLSMVWIMITPIILPASQAATDVAAPHRGFQPPPIQLLTAEGVIISLDEFTGQPVLVFFWASWCSVCKRVMPGLETIYQTYQENGFTILAVNTTFQDSPSSAVDYYNTQGYTFPMLMDMDGKVSQNFRTHALPTSVLINPDGIIHDVLIGSNLSQGSLRAWLDSFDDIAQ